MHPGEEPALEDTLHPTRCPESGDHEQPDDDERGYRDGVRFRDDDRIRQDASEQTPEPVHPVGRRHLGLLPVATAPT